jgi:mRNA deadenylase 3'-5' endonuclease subunit Ccr4
MTSFLERNWSRIPHKNVVRVMSYNVLADEGEKGSYGFVNKSATSLSFSHRGPLLLKQIERIDADIVTLQEVTHYEDFFKQNLKAKGYESIFTQKVAWNGRREGDGVVCAWRSDLFELLASRGLEQRKSGEGDGATTAVVLFVVLKHRLLSDVSIQVTTTHLKAKRGFELVRASKRVKGRYLY